MLTIRFDRQRRVVGWYGEIGLDASGITVVDWIQCNKNRDKDRTKTTQNLSARERAMAELRSKE